MDQELRQKVALFKYSLIAPLLTGTYTQSSAKEYIESVCAKKYNTPAGNMKEYAPATLKDWLRLYKRHGIDGLCPKLRSDKGTLRKTPDSIKEYIINAKLQAPKRPAVSIYQEIIAKGLVPYDKISVSTVQRILSKAHITTHTLNPVERRAFEFQFANDCWQSDISVGPYLIIDGKKVKTFIFAIIDDASRAIIHCEAFPDDTFLSLLTTFKKGVAKRGVPKKIFVDNGRVYKSEQMQLICASLGTVLCFAHPYSPESKGKIERFFHTLKNQWMNCMDWKSFHSITELNISLSQYIEDKYNRSIHSSIKQSPIDRFMKDIAKIRFLKSAEELAYTFLYRVTRKVKNDATISILGKTFETPQKYKGETINIRYDPSSVDKAYIFSDEGKIIDTIFPINKIDNSKIRRSHDTKPIDFSSFTLNE